MMGSWFTSTTDRGQQRIRNIGPVSPKVGARALKWMPPLPRVPRALEVAPVEGIVASHISFKQLLSPFIPPAPMREAQVADDRARQAHTSPV
jgi:hypothetical protein